MSSGPTQLMTPSLRSSTASSPKTNGRGDDRIVGVIAVGDDSFSRRLGRTPYRIEVVQDEQELINIFISKVQKEWDPEIVAGYEVHYASWGYLIERARAEWGTSYYLSLPMRLLILDSSKTGIS